MKKLLVIALSAGMILSMAAVSMAANVAVGGEFNYGWELSQEAGTDTDAFADTKIGVTAAITDNITGFATFKSPNLLGETNGNNVYVDESWVKFNQGFGSVQVGYLPYTVDGDVDIIDSLGDLKNKASVAVSGKVAEPVTVSGYLARMDDGDISNDSDMTNKYAVSVAYDVAAFGAKFNYINSDVDGAKATESITAYYNLAPAKVYVDYEMKPEVSGDSQDNAVLGALYDGEKIYGRAEYQVVKPDGQDDANVGFRLGYKIAKGANIEYNNCSTMGEDAVSSVKLNYVF
jgi:hypothetical protein